MFLKLLHLCFFIRSVSIVLLAGAQEQSSAGWASCPPGAIPTVSPLNISEMFYIKLVPKSVSNLSEDSSTDPDPDEEYKLNNMCASNNTGFISREKQLSDCINYSTCQLYGKTSNSSSSLGICREVFESLGFDVCLIPYSGAANITLYNASSLLDTVSKIEASLRVYFRVLDRTVVGSYFKQSEYRCLCFDSYKKWLCSSRLKNLYTSVSSSECCGNEALSVKNSTLCRIMPCLRTCQRVVQDCPYYLPSSFQSDAPMGQSNDTTELVYGGYPAFDCPRENTLKTMYEDNRCARGLCTYANPSCNETTNPCIYDSNRCTI